jgi:hypothetical protein
MVQDGKKHQCIASLERTVSSILPSGWIHSAEESGNENIFHTNGSKKKQKNDEHPRYLTFDNFPTSLSSRWSLPLKSNCSDAGITLRILLSLFFKNSCIFVIVEDSHLSRYQNT